MRWPEFRVSLRLAGIAVFLAGLVELTVFDDLQPAPFIIGAALAGFSFAPTCDSPRSRRAVSILCLLLPAGALVMYLRGRVMIGVPVFDAIVFGWLWTRARSGGGILEAPPD